MPLYPVNLCGDDIADESQVRRALGHHLGRLPADRPVIVMIHGYKHAPSRPGASPHDHILALNPRPCWKAVSWPRLLGVTGADADRDTGLDTGLEASHNTETEAAQRPEPLCIALGWEARGSLWQAYGAARSAGRGLARLISLIRDLRPGTQVEVLGHSLGARVALTALPDLPAGAMGRMVLLAGAELVSQAGACLDSPAGRGLGLLNVTSTENAVFDRALAWIIAPHRPAERPIGRGLDLPQAVNLRIDDAACRAALDRLGYAVPAPDRLLCHWSVYLRDGLFPLYRDVLTGALPLCDLARALPAPKPAPSRLRFFGVPALPFPGREAS